MCDDCTEREGKTLPDSKGGRCTPPVVVWCGNSGGQRRVAGGAKAIPAVVMAVTPNEKFVWWLLLERGISSQLSFKTLVACFGG